MATLFLPLERWFNHEGEKVGELCRLAFPTTIFGGCFLVDRAKLKNLKSTDASRSGKASMRIFLSFRGDFYCISQNDVV